MISPSLSFKTYIKSLGFKTGLVNFVRSKFKSGPFSKAKIDSLPSPILLRNNTSDYTAFQTIFVHGEYDYKLPFVPEFIIDCGANIGLTTLYFLSKFPDCEVVAIEPEDANFEMLKKNTSLFKKVNRIKAAIWIDDSKLKIVDDPEQSYWGKRVMPSNDITDDSLIDTVRIDKILKNSGRDTIDVLKIDIEGAELELFSEGYEAWLPKTKVLMIELHDRFKKGCSKSFFKALINYDFSVYTSGENLICVNNNLINGRK